MVYTCKPKWRVTPNCCITTPNMHINANLLINSTLIVITPCFLMGHSHCIWTGLVAQTWPSTCYIITAAKHSRLHVWLHQCLLVFKRYTSRMKRYLNISVKHLSSQHRAAAAAASTPSALWPALLQKGFYCFVTSNTQVTTVDMN